HLEQHPHDHPAMDHHAEGRRGDSSLRGLGQEKGGGEGCLRAMSADPREAARKLFAGPCDFVWGAQQTGDALPPGKLPEVAFVGRSNAGKSSLVNALTGRKTLARVSQTP